jgi:hypothetical protein
MSPWCFADRRFAPKAARGFVAMAVGDAAALVASLADLKAPAVPLRSMPLSALRQG